MLLCMLSCKGWRDSWHRSFRHTPSPSLKKQIGIDYRPCFKSCCSVARNRACLPGTDCSCFAHCNTQNTAALQVPLFKQTLAVELNEDIALAKVKKTFDAK